MERDLGLALLRVGVGGMMLVAHGLGKLQNLIAGQTAFADPIGIGPLPSLVLTVFAEFFCALAVVVGFKTRYAAIPLLITMLVAAFVVHAADPWGKKEFALLYALPFAFLALNGGGRFGLDGWRRKRG